MVYGKQSDSFTELNSVGGIPEIMNVVLYADSRSREFTEQLSPRLIGESDQETFFNIWKFARKNVRYKTDKPGNEIVKSPGNLLKTGSGDCKSFAVFVGSVLQNLGFDYYYRLIWENPLNPNQAHVYIIAIDSAGNEIPIDPVNDQFGVEPFYFWFSKRDYLRDSIGGLSKTLPIKLIMFILAGIFIIKSYDKD